jgi:hypothetical protein
MDYSKLGSDLSGPFLQAFKGEMTLDKATEVASYNMMMTLLLDLMAQAAGKSAVAKFLFTGFFGNVSIWIVTYLVKIASIKGVNFAQGQLHAFTMEQYKKAYVANMNIINGGVDLKEFLSETEKEEYKANVQNQLKGFFNLSRFFKSK